MIAEVWKAAYSKERHEGMLDLLLALEKCQLELANLEAQTRVQKGLAFFEEACIHSDVAKDKRLQNETQRKAAIMKLTADSSALKTINQSLNELEEKVAIGRSDVYILKRLIEFYGNN